VTATTHPRVAGYLAAVERALGDLPRERREEIVGGLREHVDAALAGAPEDVAVRAVLDRLGTPEAIAAEARDRFGLPPRRRRCVPEIVGVFMLGMGSLALPAIGWAIGIVVVWASDLFSRGQKVLATLVFPGGMYGAALAVTGGGLFPVTSCRAVGGVTTCVRDAYPSDLRIAVTWVVFLLSGVGPVVVSWLLGRTVSRARASAL
jgi:uncharacterized membrane protein